MVSNTPEVKQLNIEIIRKAIQGFESCTKAEISRSTGLSMATCNTILNEMMKSGEILLAEMEMAGVGRPSSRYSYNRDFLHVASVYVHNEEGKNTVAVSNVDAMGGVLCEKEDNPEQITFDEIRGLLEEVIGEDDKVRYITFGIPGVSRHGVIERCDIGSIVGIDIENGLRKRFGVPVEVRNDMDFITRGIFSEVCDPEDTSTLATLYFPKSEGTVGSGILIGGSVLTGSSRFTGELSYIAEAFGLTRKEQNRILQEDDREAFRNMAAKMVMILIGTVDPARVILMGNEVNEEDLSSIREYCAGIVTGEHVPILSCENNIRDSYLRGLQRAALNRVQFPISRS